MKKEERRGKEIRLKGKGLIQKAFKASDLVQGGLETRKKVGNTKN